LSIYRASIDIEHVPVAAPFDHVADGAPEIRDECLNRAAYSVGSLVAVRPFDEMVDRHRLTV
jgi:hypothetical protein